MEEQVASLKQYFQRCKTQNPEEINEEDMMLNDGEYW